MLVKRGDVPFDSVEFVYELKLDGARVIAYLDKDCTYLESRNLNDITQLFPEFLQMHKRVKSKCILDGELVFINSEGRSDFCGFQARINAKNSRVQAKYPMTYVVFDILYQNGQRLTELPLDQRKQILEQTICEGENISLVRYINEKGKALFELTKELGFEGIVAKRKDSVYQIGKRSDSWIKFKHLKEESLLICGFTLKNERIKDLLLCSHQNGNWVDEGFVYLGLNKAEERILLNHATNNPLESPLFFCSAEVVWCKPQLVCEVEYLEKTRDGKRRHAVFRGLAEQKQVGLDNS